MRGKTVMWIDHMDLLPGDPSVITSFNAINSIVVRAIGLHLKAE